MEINRPGRVMAEEMLGSYQVTEFGLRASLFFTRVHARLLRSGLSESMPNAPPLDSVLQRCLQQLQAEINRRIQEAKLVA